MSIWHVWPGSMALFSRVGKAKYEGHLRYWGERYAQFVTLDSTLTYSPGSRSVETQRNFPSEPRTSGLGGQGSHHVITLLWEHSLFAKRQQANKQRIVD